jgi:hypothetical protein
MKEAGAVRNGVAHGMKWAVHVNPMGGCNGYVKLPTGYPRVWNTYNDIGVEVHGGLTYGPDEDGWVGFDTLHAGDAWVGGVADDLPESRRTILAEERYINSPWYQEWNEDKVSAECQALALGLKTLMEA